MKKQTKNFVRFTMMVCLMMLAGVFLYYQYIGREKKASSEKVPSTEVEKLMAKDLDDSYPETAKEVLNMYLRYVQCIYNNNPEEKEFQSLVEQIRKLYHSELLAVNQEGAQQENMKKEREHFQSQKVKLVTCSVDDSVKKKKIKGKECILLKVAFLLSEPDGYKKSYQNFVLANENERWKILGFQKISGTAVQSGLKETEG